MVIVCYSYNNEGGSVMHAWEQIQLTVDYIEEHLNEKLEMGHLAEIAALSPFYFQRLFSRLVKKPVTEYIKLRRMARATELLLQKDKRILDVALDLGFSSHELFTRTFKATFGMTPEEHRRNPQVMNRMTKPQLMLQYTLIDEGVPLIADGIVIQIDLRELDRPEYYIGLEVDTPIQFINGLGIESGQDPLDALWRTFHKKKLSIMPDGSADSEEIGVSYPSAKEGFFTYFSGAKLEAASGTDKYSSWILPDGKYVVCSFEAENFEALVMDALYKAEQYLFNTWIPNHNLRTEAFCAERYASHTAETTNMEVWLKLI